MNKKVVMGIRLLLGLIFVAGGVGGFLTMNGFIAAPPPELPPKALVLMNALVETGLWNLVKLTEVVCALLLLSNRYVPLAITILAPIVVNISFFHLFLDHKGIPIVVVLVAAEVILARAYRESFRGMLNSKVDLSQP